MGQAYMQYYTHIAQQKSGLLKTIYHSLRHTYMFEQMGESSHFSYAARIGAWGFGKVFGGQWQYHDARLYPPRKGARLLDIGCGGGDYLALASSIGWSAEGIDPVPNAVANAIAKGCNARCGSAEEEISRAEGLYDAITLSHVIEHLYNPVDTLRACRRLLRPGGRIWISTPRLHSPGHSRFGADWLHLDPPRHLVLFTEDKLTSSLRTAGFAYPKFSPRGRHVTHAWKCSYAIRRGLDPLISKSTKLPLRIRISALRADLLSLFFAYRGDEIVTVAEKESIHSDATN
jgi:2-polyprenyl-3-methyl-5-hydroxy-6-metoxy-1,4-benzoquinol methylase